MRKKARGTRPFVKLMLFAASIVLAGVAVSSCYQRVTTKGPYEVFRELSPDGRLTAVATVLMRTDVPLPGPEPPRVRQKHVKLCILKGQREILSLQDLELYPDYSGHGDALDALWSPDSSSLAYRCVNKLHIVRPDSSWVEDFSPPGQATCISSFRWFDRGTLVVLTKDFSSGSRLEIGYPSFDADFSGADLWRLEIDAGRWTRIVHFPTQELSFLFRGAGFRVDELSPFAPLVAIHDGEQMRVYDYSLEEAVFNHAITGPVDGVWWIDRNRCLIMTNNLSAHKPLFFEINVADSSVTELTEKLRSHWDGNYLKMDWYRKALAQ
jgi:hypothetical protein